MPPDPHDPSLPPSRSGATPRNPARAPGLPPSRPDMLSSSRGDEDPASASQARNKPLRLVLGAVGILVLAVCAALTVSVAAGVVIPALRASRQPTETPLSDGTAVVTQFCTDELSQRYAEAYALFSPHLQSQLTQDQFVSRAQQLDAADGTVSQCEPLQGGETPLTDTSASFDMAVSRTRQGTTTDFSGAIGVVKNGSTWTIDSLASSLGLT